MNADLAHFKSFALELNRQVSTGEVTYDALYEAFPALISVNRLNTIGIELLSKDAEQKLNCSSHELNQMNPEARVKAIVQPDDLVRLAPQLVSWAKTATPTDVFTCIQRVKGLYDTEYTAYLCATTLNPIHKVMIAVSYPLADTVWFREQSRDIFRAQDYIAEHLADFERLSPREIEVLTLIAKGFSNPDVSRLLHITEATAKDHRKAIKHKLGLTTTAELVMFALAFGLVEIQP